MYALRLTTPRNDEQFKEDFKLYKLVMFHEVGKETEKPHYQGLIESVTPKEVKSIRNLINRKYGSGNEVYSLQVQKCEFKYGRYIVKDGDLVINTLWDEDTLAYYQTLSKDIQTEQKEKVKLKKLTFTEEVVNGYNPAIHDMGDNIFYMKRNIITYIRTCYKGGKPHSNNVIQSIVNGILVKHYCNQWINKFSDDRFFT